MLNRRLLRRAWLAAPAAAALAAIALTGQAQAAASRAAYPAMYIAMTSARPLSSLRESKPIPGQRPGTRPMAPVHLADEDHR